MTFARSIALVAVCAIALAGCSNDATRPASAHNPLGTAADALRAPTVAGDGCEGLPTAPDELRVDLIDPVFTNPMAALNPLFPVGELDRAILLGLSDGERFRTETTRLSGSQTILIDGEPVATLISQYVAWKDRRIGEVAIDWYGQDDEGNVWYFGEDVFNYEEGVVVDRDGTWLAGQDGPAAMIMPADPQVGNVWRPENACPIVFEEVTALETGVTVQGPSGPVAGALLVQELHMDGTYENKTFAPGYGEFSTGSGLNVEALALAVPTDYLGGEPPEDLDDLSDAAESVFNVARNGGWKRIRSLFAEIKEDWEDYEATGVPPLLAAQMGDAIDGLGEAIAARDRMEVRQAAVDIALACLDFELRYEARSEIDLDLIEVWLLQLQIDLAARDRGGIRSDLETIRVISDRLEPMLAGSIEGELASLRNAAQAGDEAALSAGATHLHDTVAKLTLNVAQ